MSEGKIEGGGMMTITEFLEARIAEDEEACKTLMIAEDGEACETLMFTRLRRPRAECAAKREILRLHSNGHHWVRPDGTKGYYQDDPSCWVGAYDPDYGDSAECETLRALAKAYSTHPDYREKW